MGLAEKRAIQEFQTQRYEGWQKKIESACKYMPEFLIEWETLALDGQTHLFQEGFEKVYFEPLVLALTSVCQDQMGRDALKTRLKKIHICNKSGFYSPRQAITFENGILKIDHEPTSNMQDINDRSKQIQTVLEEKL